MTPGLRRDLLAALERPHRLGTIGGDLEEQLAHCASFSSVLDDIAGEGTLEYGVDLGTGGGLPGVALAAMRPAMRWLLVDARVARAHEVERTVLRLGLNDRVVVKAIEAQALGHDAATREHADVAVARAFGPPSITAECAAGVVRVGGALVVSEPPSSEDAVDRWDDAGLAYLGFSPPRFVHVDGLRFAVFTKEAPAPDPIPRLPARANRGWLGP